MFAKFVSFSTWLIRILLALAENVGRTCQVVGAAVLGRNLSHHVTFVPPELLEESRQPYPVTTEVFPAYILMHACQGTVIDCLHLAV